MINQIKEAFSSITDPRIDRAKKHSLVDILTISTLATISGADGWEHIEMFGKIKQKWLSKFLKLPNGIPSHDTIARVFSRIDPGEFQNAFLKWVQNIKINVKGKVIAIDGKALRRSFDNATGKSALHLVSAWATEANLVLCQCKVSEKSNEITAIPKLLDFLDISGAIITIDAMGCQKNIAEKIRKEKADYVLALKKNHSEFYSEVQYLFDTGLKSSFRNMMHDVHECIDGGHGRIETRTCYCLNAMDWFPNNEEWKDMKTIAMVKSVVENGSKQSEQTRYYISSLPLNAQNLAKAVRQHWGIENSLHWVLDVTFREDESRVRKGNASENLAIIRRIALNIIKRKKPKGMSAKKALLAASWDTDFALQTLFGD